MHMHPFQGGTSRSGMKLETFVSNFEFNSHTLFTPLTVTLLSGHRSELRNITIRWFYIELNSFSCSLSSLTFRRASHRSNASFYRNVLLNHQIQSTSSHLECKSELGGFTLGSSMKQPHLAGAIRLNYGKQSSCLKMTSRGTP